MSVAFSVRISKTWHYLPRKFALLFGHKKRFGTVLDVHRRRGLTFQRISKHKLFFNKTYNHILRRVGLNRDCVFLYSDSQTKHSFIMV